MFMLHNHNRKAVKLSFVLKASVAFTRGVGAGAFYHPFQGLMEKPPFLKRSSVEVGGNAFLGVSLSRNSAYGLESETLQTAFDLNEVADRSYEYVLATNDDGWLIGGGESGPYKLPASDSSHITIMDMGTFEEALGGIPPSDIIEAIESGNILVPQMEVVPTQVRMNPNNPPELELLFNVEPTFPTKAVPLPINWQLRFVANQLVDYFEFPNQVIPDRFHCSMTRKIQFRSLKHRKKYFKKTREAIRKWREAGPQPLIGDDTWKYYYSDGEASSDNVNGVDEYASGLWIFSNRQNRTHYIKPNFFPPYLEDPDKLHVIHEMLEERYMPHLHVYVSIPMIFMGLAVVLISIGSAVWYDKRRKKQAKDECVTAKSSSSTDLSTSDTDDNLHKSLHSCDFVGLS